MGLILIRHVVLNYSASCTHAHIVLFKRTCRLLAANEDFFVTNDEKYQTCLIFGLHVTNDENAVNVARTRGNFVDPTCHEKQTRYLVEEEKCCSALLYSTQIALFLIMLCAGCIIFNNAVCRLYYI